MASAVTQPDLKLLAADATQLLEWFEKRELSPQEFLANQLQAIEVLQPDINAYISFRPEQVLQDLSGVHKTNLYRIYQLLLKTISMLLVM